MEDSEKDPEMRRASAWSWWWDCRDWYFKQQF